MTSPSWLQRASPAPPRTWAVRRLLANSDAPATSPQRSAENPRDPTSVHGLCAGQPCHPGRPRPPSRGCTRCDQSPRLVLGKAPRPRSATGPARAEQRTSHATTSATRMSSLPRRRLVGAAWRQRVMCAVASLAPWSGSARRAGSFRQSTVPLEPPAPCVRRQFQGADD
jgi:hypothetical protein